MLLANVLDRCAITSQILVVAAERWDDYWTAYIGVVPGECHDEEMEGVLATGHKLDEPLARHLFPNMAGRPYTR